MSRFAEASERAGRALQVDENLRRWESDRKAAEALVTAGKPERTRPTSLRLNDGVARSQPGPELTAAVSRIFLTPPQAVRSVLFCTVPGEPASAFACRSAEILASKWGRRVGFLGDGAANLAPELSDSARALITPIAWNTPGCAHPSDIAASAQCSVAQCLRSTETESDNLACTACVGDLLDTLDFVIVNARPRSAEAIVPAARHVEGVVVLVTQNLTRRASVHAFVTSLRRWQVNLLGVILTSRPSLEAS